MSTLYVDTINEKTTGNGIYMPGHILQVVQATSGTGMQTSVANTWHDLAPTVTITPKSSSSKVLVSHTGAMMHYVLTGSGFFRLLRDSTEVVQVGRTYTELPSNDWQGYIAAFEYLDEPSTTSAVTYKWQIQISNSGGAVRHNDSSGSFTPKAITMAKEVGG